MGSIIIPSNTISLDAFQSPYVWEVSLLILNTIAAPISIPIRMGSIIKPIENTQLFMKKMYLIFYSYWSNAMHWFINYRKLNIMLY